MRHFIPGGAIRALRIYFFNLLDDQNGALTNINVRSTETWKWAAWLAGLKSRPLAKIFTPAARPFTAAKRI